MWAGAESIRLWGGSSINQCMHPAEHSSSAYQSRHEHCIQCRRRGQSGEASLEGFSMSQVLILKTMENQENILSRPVALPEQNWWQCGVKNRVKRKWKLRKWVQGFRACTYEMAYKIVCRHKLLLGEDGRVYLIKIEVNPEWSMSYLIVTVLFFSLQQFVHDFFYCTKYCLES